MLYYPKRQQQTVAVQVESGRGCSDVSAEVITQRLYFMVENDMMPLNVVDDEGFHELLTFTDPGYCIPSGGIITSRVETRYSEKKDKL